MSAGAALLLVGGAVVALLVLVLGLRLHAFLSLLLVSLGVATVGGIPLGEVAGEVQRAMGGTLGYIAVVLGVGAMLGELLHRSGGVQRIAVTLLDTFGERGAPTAFGLIGLLVAIPVFFDVAFILLIPLAKRASRRAGRPLVAFAVPLLAGLAVAHAFVPPTPGPVAVAGLLGAELGWVILFGLAAGVPALAVGGLLWGRHLTHRELRSPANPHAVADEPDEQNKPAPEHGESHGEAPAAGPTFGLALGLILLPLVLILVATVSGVLLDDGGPRGALQMLGHPFVALLLTTLLASAMLSRRCGWTSEEVMALVDRSLAPLGAILLLTGAGGVLGKVIQATGAGAAVAEAMSRTGLPLLVLGFVLALGMRLAQGSATVSMVTAAGLVAPVAEAAAPSPALLGALTVAVAAGATACSHVNDSGFWLVSRYLGLDEAQTLRTWTAATALVGFTGFLVVLALGASL
ncbi:MAG: gluconate:H+ symporter [Acidobacteriota bacterium]